MNQEHFGSGVHVWQWLKTLYIKSELAAFPELSILDVNVAEVVSLRTQLWYRGFSLKILNSEAEYHRFELSVGSNSSSEKSHRYKTSLKTQTQVFDGKTLPVRSGLSVSGPEKLLLLQLGPVTLITAGESVCGSLWRVNSSVPNGGCTECVTEQLNLIVTAKGRDKTAASLSSNPPPSSTWTKSQLLPAGRLRAAAFKWKTFIGFFDFTFSHLITHQMSRRLFEKDFTLTLTWPVVTFSPTGRTTCEREAVTPWTGGGATYSWFHIKSRKIYRK